MKEISTQVLIVGGGCSGVAAGIQAARLGVSTIIIEETPWVGGMITAAGVSAFDGNKYALGGGIFGELRSMIEDYYGGADKTFTGWISLTCFEPKIGNEFLKELCKRERFLQVLTETSLLEVLKDGNAIVGVKVRSKDGEEIVIKATVTIEATEFGDVLELADVPYRFGRDPKSDTGEPSAPDERDYDVQDMTYCTILKNYHSPAKPVLPSSDYNPKLFVNSTAVDSTTTDEEYLNHKLHSWESFISYAALPNDKYLLNWPMRANDFPTTKDIYDAVGDRSKFYKKMKQHTLNYVHYMQTKLGHPEWGIAEDEFPTEDFLPFIPYVRESRRVKGVTLMKENDVVPYDGTNRPRFRVDSVAVGDYFLDHHHSSMFKEPSERLIEKLPANAPFQIPIGALIPEQNDGLICAEKSISVTHIVNGCTRLQPVVMLIGQAAGVIAALSVEQDIHPRDVNFREVQETLIDQGCQVFPYKDIYRNTELFKPVQKLASLAIIAHDADYNFSPEQKVTEKEIHDWVHLLPLTKTIQDAFIVALKGRTRGETFKHLYLAVLHSC